MPEVKLVGNLLGANTKGVLLDDVTNMVFALAIGQVFLTWVPTQGVNILSYRIHYPKISHFYRMQSLPFDGVIT